MRERPAGRFLLILGVMIFLAAGCQSTSSVPSLLSRNSSTSKNSPSADIAWKKKDAPKREEPIRTAAFQDPAGPKLEMPPIPELMLKEAPTVEPRPLKTVQAQPVGFKKHHHAGPPMPVAPPHAPNEMNPTLLPTYAIRPPDVLLIESQKGLLTQPIRGQHLVRVDGTVGLGIYGSAAVAGKTIQQAREEIARVIYARLDQKTLKIEDVLDGLSVDVLAYNSSVYYIITDGAGLGEQVYRFPVTGNETVLDAISNINGLPVVASPKRIWVARRNGGEPGPGDSVLPVDWKGITQMGMMNTNWQVMPGDRIYVQADPMRRFNNNLAKILEPVERLFGATLLGSQAVNSVHSGTTIVR